MTIPRDTEQINSRGYRESMPEEYRQEPEWTERALRIQQYLRQHTGETLMPAQIAKAIGTTTSRVDDAIITLTRLDPRLATDETGVYYIPEEE